MYVGAVEGTQIGQYRIDRTLGRGGFGVVYVGTDLRLGRRAAIKQLLPELTGNREIIERFFNEAKAAANINHPGIVEIYDVGYHTDGSAYFAMKLLDGSSLATRLRAAGPMAIDIAATVARQVASALTAAHVRGIVHRDLKPDNVMLVADDEIAIGERAIVLDFGIAKLFGDNAVSAQTRTGMMMGTPSYMSPEQCRGAGEVDHRTDIYALGCMVYEMLAGRPPFVAQGAGEVLGMHQFVEPPALRSLRADVPVELEAIVMRALSKRADLRQQQMAELATAFQTFGVSGVRSREPAAAAAAPSTSAPPSASAAITPPLHVLEPITPQPRPGSSRRPADASLPLPHAAMPTPTPVGFAAPVPPPQGNWMAIAALVLGIVGVVACWVPVLGWMGAILGIAFGIAGLVRSSTTRTGKAMALAGLITGTFGVVIGVVFVVISLSGFNRYMNKAKTSEAQLQLRRIDRGIKTYWMERAELPPNAQSVMPEADGSACSSPNGKMAPRMAREDPGWQALDFQLDEPTRFSYHWTRTSPTAGVALAVGDLDCDGTLSTYRLDVTVVQGNVTTVLSDPTPD